MNKTLFNALVSISMTSASAKQLANEVIANSSPDLIKQLYAKIQQLESTISDLTALVNEPEEISDDESHALALSLMARLRDTDASSLHQFDRSYLRLFPKFVRHVVATVLKNKALELKTEPLAIWLDVIALGGEL
jgi:ABC-type transporter Mla subunit MlaD